MIMARNGLYLVETGHDHENHLAGGQVRWGVGGVGQL